MTTPDRVYDYADPQARQAHDVLIPRLEQILSARSWPQGARAIDYGCGNGSLTAWVASRGFKAVGVDLSPSGIAMAAKAYPDVAFSTDVTAEHIAAMGPFDLGLCINVIAHCADPSTGPRKIFDNLKPGGTLILATPYYGYFKNVVLAMTGKLDDHLHNLWPGRYLHFFSIAMIKQLLGGIGYADIEVARVGRIPALAKVMVVSARKPAGPAPTSTLQ
jgi:SAM-dependent methyltransferase